MRVEKSRGRTRTPVLVVSAVSAGLLAACTSSPQTGSTVIKTSGKEYFAESEYGVKASPRVTSKRSGLQRGGGRDQIGKPYKVKGKWYRPKEDPDYSKVGAASWYGDAFHGRLTANGEIYDMTHLTAAHPTMPLPSYARVTNTANNSSVIVRVNDRGPFASDRIIDLSKKAAELLDYTHAGVARVKVEYVGRAPLHGQDDQYLMASYRPGSIAPDGNDGLASGVMVAMAGPTPSFGFGTAPKAVVFPGQLTDTGSRAGEQRTATAPVAPDASQAAGTTTQAPETSPALPEDFALPTAGPVVPERPAPQPLIAGAPDKAPRLLSYADRRVSQASQALDRFASNGMNPADIVDAWQRRTEPAHSAVPDRAYVLAGTFDDRRAADIAARRLGGRVVADHGDWTVVLDTGSGKQLDALLQFAWSNGAPDALIVRD
ncbi:MAG: septal ring lytic transglycosylase RlpA family protein [Rhizobiaceae bacterium]|nr:septal ring lytic transglycosylase RlpA family protein [Rhizobiaceae bacterium]MCV0406292.1 septal ring lytic transglycosylase RlpA family protein [Rhizobiaceae bacterium]